MHFVGAVIGVMAAIVLSIYPSHQPPIQPLHKHGLAIAYEILSRMVARSMNYVVLSYFQYKQGALRQAQQYLAANYKYRLISFHSFRATGERKIFSECGVNLETPGAMGRFRLKKGVELTEAEFVAWSKHLLKATLLTNCLEHKRTMSVVTIF